MKKHIAQFFKFLEDKEDKPIPLKLKFLNPNVFKLTKEDLNVKGDAGAAGPAGLDLSRTDIKELPQGLKVDVDLYLSHCTSLKELPQGLQVGRDLILDGCTSLEELPQDLKVGGYLILDGCTSLKELPQGLKVRYLSLYNCTSLKELPQGLEVGGNLDLRNTPIAEKYPKEEIRKMIEDGGGYVKGKIYT